VRAIQVEKGSEGNYARGINVVVGDVIVTLDVVEIDELANLRLLIEIP
jgi:hypothetical protein